MVLAVDMGYGHLRAAHAVAERLGCEVERADEAPFVSGEGERRLWGAVRGVHEGLSRLSRAPLGIGDLMRSVLDALTEIAPLHGPYTHSDPDVAARYLDFLIARGLGRGLVASLRSTARPLLATYYAPAIAAARAGLSDVYCLVTDADMHRVWVPADVASAPVHYFAPSSRVVSRLLAYGVPRAQITFSGFPLPESLVGGQDLHIARANLSRRLVRLDPKRNFRRQHEYEISRLVGDLPSEEDGQPPLLTFAVGGAGAQADLASEFMPSLRPMISGHRLRIALVAGTRREVVETLARAIDRAGLTRYLGSGVTVLLEDDFPSYYRRFNELLARSDILWTKPSEMSFYAALGLPLVLAKPLGSHERYNRRWLRDHGVGLKQRDPRFAAGWLSEWLEDGSLAAAAWSGFSRLPKRGTQVIADAMIAG